MSTSDRWTPNEPKQWCAGCGAALWPYSTIYEWPSLAGLLVLCRVCAKHYNNAVISRWDRPLIGHKDIQRLKKGGKR